MSRHGWRKRHTAASRRQFRRDVGAKSEPLGHGQTPRKPNAPQREGEVVAVAHGEEKAAGWRAGLWRRSSENLLMFEERVYGHLYSASESSL
jgi:hypothetical protein